MFIFGLSSPLRIRLGIAVEGVSHCSVIISSFCVFCALTLSSNVFDNIFNDLNGLVKLSDLDLHWVGPHLDLLENNRGQRSDGKPLKLHELHAEEFLITWCQK